MRHASVAQLVEQGTENPRVIGSIPIGGTIYADVAHLVERHLAKVEVASSSLVVRSKLKALTEKSVRAFSCIQAFLKTGLSLVFTVKERFLYKIGNKICIRKVGYGIILINPAGSKCIQCCWPENGEKRKECMKGLALRYEQEERR